MYRRLNDEKYYRKFYFQDSFHAQCMDVEPLSLVQIGRSAEVVRNIINAPAFKQVKHIIASGCGDSNLVAFAAKGAFEYYLPEVEYEAVEAIELSRHYDYEGRSEDTIAFFISYSGKIYRTIEAMEQCKRHGITTVAVTDNPESATAKAADILCYANIPKGDNNAGLRTYFANVLTMMTMAATIGELQYGGEKVSAFGDAVRAYHRDFFAKLAEIDDCCFAAAISWMDKKFLEIAGDGPQFWAGKFIQAKVVELSGDACAVIDSENFKHVNVMMEPGEEIGELVLINTNDSNLSQIVDTVKVMTGRGKREVLLFCDKRPEEIGIDGGVKYCPMPVPDREHNFLAPLYTYLPGAIFAGFRHTTIGEPMFRGGMDPSIFIPTYYSPVDVVDL